jgi:hypothetical protein
MADRTRPRLTPAFLVLLTVALVTLSARADFIFLNDGFTLQGRVIKEYEYIHDPSGLQVAISKLGGFYMVDDGVRRVLFPKSLVAGAEHIDRRAQLEHLNFNPARKNWHPGGRPLKPFRVTETGPWDPATGSRTVNMASASEPTVIQIDELVNTLNPYAMEVVVRNYVRTYVTYLTSEFPPDTILDMVRNQVNKEAEQAKRALTFDDKLRVARFAAQANWHEKALAEIKDLIKQYPSELPKLAPLQRDIKSSQLKLKLEELDDAMAAGQHGLAQNLLANLDEEGANTAEQTKLSALRNKYKQQNAELERMRKLLLVRKQQAASSSLTATVAPLIEEIERNLNLDNASNLSVFLKLADQEDRLAARGQPAMLSAEQQLALAVTGWLMGKDGAENNKEAAEKLARGRSFLQKFLLTDDEPQRKQMVTEYLAREPLRVDEITQLIDQLPPPRAEAYSKSTLDLVTHSDPLWPNGVKYRLFLPPEYHHHRSYPVLFLIPSLGQTYESTAEGWLEPAARKGFIVVVPEWTDTQQDRYQGTDKDHAAVTEVLRDIRRRFRIDNNRVCIAGIASGANLVFDVALTRPHLFAGAVVVTGHTPEGIEQLRYNAQYLPFYVVDGSKNRYREKEGFANRDALMKLFEYWIPKGYPSLFVEYQGRGFETSAYPAEIPIIFDWLSRRKRSDAMPELGKADVTGNRLGQEFRAVRSTVNRFYWIGFDDLKASRQTPVLVTAVWEKHAPNSLRAVMSGMKSARVWLNAKMVNFENPVEIDIKGPPRAGWEAPKFKQKLEPSTAILLEDFYQRGDSKNLFVQYVDFTFSR